MDTNQLLSIHDIPDDLLCDIFLLILPRNVKQNLVKIVDNRKALISLCLTCKRWHRLAYSYPLLWTRVIDFEEDTPEHIAEFLRRSGSVPFEIPSDAIQKNEQPLKVLQTIFEHRSRIKTMNLNILYSPWVFICKNFLSYPAPNLQFMNLITRSPFPSCSFSGPLFANHAPQLTQFHMQRCLTDFSSPVLHNLTALSVIDIVAPAPLRQTTNPSKIAPTVEGWLQILKDMPALRYLTLLNSITWTDNFQGTRFVNISLPCLRLLSLDVPFGEGAVFLEFLEIPPSCGIRLRSKVRGAFWQGTLDSCHTALQGPKILSALSNQLSQRSVLPEGGKQYLQAKLLDGNRIHFGNSPRIGQLWNITEADELEQHAQRSTEPLVWLVLYFADDFPIARRFLRQLLALYEPTFSTTTDLDLWIDEQSNVTHEDFAFLSRFTNFSALQRLDIYGQSVIHLLPLFNSLSQLGEPVFPSLRLLRLTGTTFNDEVYQIVLDFLLYRAALNAPLWRFIIFNGEISNKMMSDLEEKSRVEVMSENR